MKLSNPLSPTPVFTWLLPHHRVLVWGAITLSVLVCGSVSWLHFRQQQVLERTVTTLENIREARIELNKGFLYTSLAGDPASPFNRDQGLALLQQAIAAFEGSLRAVRKTFPLSTADDPAGVGAKFQDDILVFRDRLAQWSRTATRQPGLETNLRIAFYNLERQADRIDGLIQQDLRQHSSRLNLLFALTLWGAAMLLAGICGAVFLAGIAQQKAETALRRNEEQLKLAIEGSGVGLWDWNVRTGELQYNERWAEMIGYTMEELSPTSIDTWRNLVHPDDRVRSDVLLRRHFTGELPVYECEERMKHKDGHWVWILDRGAVSHWDEEKNPVRMAGTHLDITDRKRSEEMLQKRAELLSLSQQAARMGVYDWDLVSNREHWTPEMRDLMGMQTDPQTNYRESWFAHIHPEDRVRSESAFREWINSGRQEEMREEYRIIRNGEVRWIEARGRIIVDPAGKALRMIGTNMDITERKRSEQLMAQEKERLSVTLRSIGDGVITTDIHGNVSLLNKAAETMTGWQSEEAIGRPLTEIFVIINEHTRKACRNPVEAVLQTGDIVELANHTCLIAKDGQERVIADSGAPIQDSNGRVIGVVLVFRDMTEKQRLNDSLQRAQKLESLGMLAGGIAHDFNNLLSGIFGNVEMARESLTGGKADQAPKYLTKALGVFERARGLTQQLLTFSKGGSPIRKTIPLAPLVRNSVLFALSGSNVSCRLEIADDLWHCDCDENQIGQVIDNIIINAKQAMPLGGQIVIIGENVCLEPGRGGTSSRVGNFVRISIQDQGIGMPREILSRIFDPFFSTKEAGHGLGLATAFSIIQHHDGWIDVESQPGKGSAFNLFLPASPMAQPAGAEPILETHQGSGVVLVMDDEAFMREILEEMLQDMGYRVIKTKDGDEALASFIQAEESGKPYTACILDLTVPGGRGGRDTAAEIRKIRPEALIAAASGYSEDPVMSNPTAHGFTDRIIKPFRKNDLASLMKRLTAGRS